MSLEDKEKKSGQIFNTRTSRLYKLKKNIKHRRKEFVPGKETRKDHTDVKNIKKLKAKEYTSAKGRLTSKIEEKKLYVKEKKVKSETEGTKTSLHRSYTHIDRYLTQWMINFIAIPNN